MMQANVRKNMQRKIFEREKQKKVALLNIQERMKKLNIPLPAEWDTMDLDAKLEWAEDEIKVEKRL